MHAHAAAVRLEEAFRRIERERMREMPLLNPALRVEAVGLTAWGDGWLGALITPWFINLVMLPCDERAWAALKPTSTTIETFPFGDFEFLVARERKLGTYKSCTLFSPALEFANQDAARRAARVALAALHVVPKPPLPRTARISRRAFLRGEFQRRPT